MLAERIKQTADNLSGMAPHFGRRKCIECCKALAAARETKQQKIERLKKKAGVTW